MNTLAFGLLLIFSAVMVFGVCFTFGLLFTLIDPLAEHLPDIFDDFSMRAVLVFCALGAIAVALFLAVAWIIGAVAGLFL